MFNNLSETRWESKVSLKEWIKNNQPESGWLYVFENWSLPIYGKRDLKKLESMDFKQTFKSVVWNFDIWLTSQEFHTLIQNAYWEQWHKKEIIILDEISSIDNLYSLHLWHGPTFAFKNIALEFLARYLSVINKDMQTALWASSWDTINAAHYSVKWLSNMRSIFLLPQKWPSEVQRLQAIANDIDNTMTILINWDFDDAQSIIKLFNTSEEYKGFREENNFMTFNSIQILRVIAQMVYYFRAYSESVNKWIINSWNLLNFSVPSANMWDALAGLYAKEMWLPIWKINIATNENDMLDQLLKHWVYKVKLDVNWNRKKAIRTDAPSQDITISNNFERTLYWANWWDYEQIKKRMNKLEKTWEYEIDRATLYKLKTAFTSSRASDVEIKQTIQEVYTKFNKIVDPHSATWIFPFLRMPSEIPTICIETAHAIQFNSPEWVPETEEYQDEIEILRERGKEVKEWEDYLTSWVKPNEIKRKVLDAINVIENR